MNRTCTFKHAGSAILAFILLTCSLNAEDSAEGALATTFRTHVSEVQLTLSATDENNHAVATLNPADFAVVDRDFIVRSFRSFSRAEYTRLDVVILLDTSGSIAPRFPQEVAQMLDLLSQTSGVPEESISVLSFHGLKPTEICRGNCRAAEALDAISSASAGGPTPLFDSLGFAAESLSQASDVRTRRVVILLSDGEDTISRLTAREAITDLLENDVQVYALDVNATASSHGSWFLQELSAATGGRFFPLSAGARAVADAVLADFHASYRVSYRLPYLAAGFHTIRILPTHNLNLSFRSRQGYYYPAGR